MKLTQVAVQLYTCRDTLRDAAGFAKTLSRLRKIGYTAVEAAGLGSATFEEFTRILADNGMTCCSSHESDILNSPAKVVDRINALGCKIAVFPHPGGVDFSSRKSLDDMIAKLQHAGEVMQQAGKTLCYHNHNIEFRKLDGKVALDLIYAGASSAALKAELDTYWVQYGGGDVLAWCRKMAGRLPIIHIKDYQTTPKSEPDFCEIGSGVLDFKAIIAAAETAGCQWFVVEQDSCPGDPLESLEKSFRYIQEHLASRGAAD
jgi:sugar phosphate isomerase/epimerase